MLNFKETKNKSALSTRWAQMSKQEQIIEKKKMEIQAKAEAQKQAAALAAQAKLSNSTIDEKSPGNIFSNDGSFMSQYKALLEKQKQEKEKKEQKEKLEEEKKVKKNEAKHKPAEAQSKNESKEPSKGHVMHESDEKRPTERSSRDRHRRWNDRGRNRHHSPTTPVVEDRKKGAEKSSIPSLMQIPVRAPENQLPNSHSQWNMHGGSESEPEANTEDREMASQEHVGPCPPGPGSMVTCPMGPNQMGSGPMGPGPLGPGPMGPGPLGPGPMGPGPMGPGPMGPGPMGPGPMGPGPMGPGPMGPGPMGPGPMGPRSMGPGPMGPGPMGPGPIGTGPMGGSGGPGSMGPGPMGPGPMGAPPMGPNMDAMTPSSMASGLMGSGQNMSSGPNPMMGPNGPMPPFLGGPPNFPMPPNFLGPNGPRGPCGPGSLPPNMCGPNMRPGPGPSGPMPPFFGPPFPNPAMMGPNGPPNSIMPPNSMNNANMPFMGSPSFGPNGPNFGPNGPNGPNFRPNGPPNMPFIPPNSMPSNSLLTIPEPKPLDAVSIPPPEPIKIQNIPPPMPLPLNHIPKPKDLDPGNIPAPPNSTQVLSADMFPPPVQRAAAEVASNGDHWENVLKAIHSQDQNMWFLHNTNSNEYKAFRELVKKMRNEGVNESKSEVKPEDKYEPEFSLEDDDSYDGNRYVKQEAEYGMQYNSDVKREDDDSQNKDSESRRRERKRKSRWGNDPPADIKPPGVVAPLPPVMPGTKLAKVDEDGIRLTNVNRNNPALMQYAMTNYGTTNLSAEDWKKCEDNFKLNLLYQDMLKKRQEVERLAAAGKHKYEYDSDEDTSDGTWEHRLRAKEMNATEKWANELTKQAAGKHHIGDFLPPEELKKFMEKYSAIKSGKEPDLSDYKEFKLKEDNVGFKMLQKLGWNEGQGLGAEGSGIVEPINKANQPVANLGLGASSSDMVSSEDDEFDAYRKRMMLAYRFRPNPLNNPRRPYY
ncbi:unnamed protein product [Parnassius mnemosyne]|uniref:G-patch domain-containing protein n=1 Tax=Parnassius mnemosyne TaxID=213953 RepID=A0AAV1KEL6_9NEOP